MKKLLDLENSGMNMAIDGQFLYILCNLTLYKYDLNDMSQTYGNRLKKCQ